MALGAQTLPQLHALLHIISFFPEISIVLPLSHLSCHPLLLLSPLSPVFLLSPFSTEVTLLLSTLSHPLPFSSDWLLWCSGRVTGLCGPWSYLALTACYLHGDGWLRRCRALLLTTAEDREHTWDTSPTLSHLLFSLFLQVFWFFFSPSLNFLLFCPFVFLASLWKVAEGLHGRLMSFLLQWHSLWGVPLDRCVCT